MGDYDYGPLRTYEIAWKSGHVETVQGHQVLFESHRLGGHDFLSSLFGTVATETRREPDPRFTIHGMFGDHWRLIITAPEAELHSIRDVTDREPIPGSLAS